MQAYYFSMIIGHDNINAIAKQLIPNIGNDIVVVSASIALTDRHVTTKFFIFIFEIG